jgi:hypothetical protein
MSWKYIYFKAGNREFPVMFPEDMVHSVMADAIRFYMLKTANDMSNGMLSREALEKLADEVKPVSAGFVTLDIGSCSEGSETLKIKARPDDAKRLRTHSYTHGQLL